jgi:hypothetical protein
MRLKIRLIARLVLMITAVNMVVTLILGSLFYYIWPQNYFTWFPAIPVFFWLIGIGMAVSLELTQTAKPDAVTMTYMVARGIKILLTTVFIGIYAWVVHTDIKPFGLTTLAFYITFLVIETYVFYLYEKRRKKRKSNVEPDSEPEDQAVSEHEIDIDA